MRKGQKMTEEQKLKISKARIGKYKGSDNPKWRGGRIHRKDGRVMVYKPEHPYANACGGTHILEYRLIAEMKIGRYLLPSEIVHHIDGNVFNNHPDNLQVMTQK